MTIRITVHNTAPNPGPLSVVGIRQMANVGGEVVVGAQHFLGPDCYQEFWLHDYQFLTVVEVKNGRPPDAAEPVAPVPAAPQPIDDVPA